MDGNIGRRPGQLAAAVRSLIQSTHQPKPTNSPLHELTQTLGGPGTGQKKPEVVECRNKDTLSPTHTIWKEQICGSWTFETIGSIHVIEDKQS